MAGLPWIKVWTAVRDHPKVQRLERELGVKDGLGVVVRLWCWTADYHPGGDIPAADGPTVAKSARGDASKRSATDVLSTLVSSGLLDPIPDGYRVHDWQDMQIVHLEAEEKRKARARDRQAAYRARHGIGVTVTPGGMRDVTRDVTCDVTRDTVTEKEKEKEIKIPSPARLRSTPAGGRGETGGLGPLGSQLVAEVEAGIGHGLVPARNGQAEELERQVTAMGGVAEAKAFLASTCRQRSTEPQSVAWLVKVLAGVASSGAAP